MPSVLQEWVVDLPLRAQGTLLAAVRGCDTQPKLPLDSIPRRLVGFLRWCFMNPADEREVGILGGFYNPDPPTEDEWKASELGHLPEHFYSHLSHGFEVIGYCHPDPRIAKAALDIYRKMVVNLHLQPEGEERMMARLNEDRIATNSVVS